MLHAAWSKMSTYISCTTFSEDTAFSQPMQDRADMKIRLWLQSNHQRQTNGVIHAYASICMGNGEPFAQNILFLLAPLQACTA
jgi:hypothetical protein